MKSKILSQSLMLGVLSLSISFTATAQKEGKDVFTKTRVFKADPTYLENCKAGKCEVLTILRHGKNESIKLVIPRKKPKTVLNIYKAADFEMFLSKERETLPSAIVTLTVEKGDTKPELDISTLRDGIFYAVVNYPDGEITFRIDLQTK
jgi:hypothetical protein